MTALPFSATPMTLSVVLPVYGNALNLRPLHARLTAALAALPAMAPTIGTAWALIFVDDACPFGSGAVLHELAAADPCVTVISLPQNVGQHRAILAGLRAARGTWTVIMDADLQDPPEAIGALLHAAETGPVNAVFAGRRGRYESWPKLLTSRLFKAVQSLAAGVPRDAGLFVLIDARLRSRLLAMAAEPLMVGVPPSIVAMIGCAGLPLRSIPITREARTAGESTYTPVLRMRSARRAIGWALRWKWLRARGRVGLTETPEGYA